MKLLIVIIILILLIFILFIMTHSHNSEYTNSDNASIQNNLSHNYYEFEDKYYDGIIKKLDNYSNYCEDVISFFNENFNIDQRIKKLQTCINKMDRIRTYYYNLGENGKNLFENEAKDYFKSWSKNDIIINKSGDNYRFEFDKISFNNYNFLTYLLGVYINDTEAQKKHLEQEEKYYKISEHIENEEEAEKQREKEEKQKYIASIKETIVQKLESSDNVLQSNLIKEFIEDDRYYVRKALKEMEEHNEITKEKHGNSYILILTNKIDI